MFPVTNLVHTGRARQANPIRNSLPAISAGADLKAVDSSRVCRTDDTGNVAAARVRGISTEADLKNGVRLLKSLRD